MNLAAVPIGIDPPNEVNVVIEVPIGGEPIKYEMHKPSGSCADGRPVSFYTAMHALLRGNYGFIPHTLSDDGDPCDVLIANTRAITPGAIMSCRIVGVMIMEDEHGGDEKLIGVPGRKLTARYDHVENYTDLPQIAIQQIEHFFRHYKDLEPGKWVKIMRWGDADGSAPDGAGRRSSRPRRRRNGARRGIAAKRNPLRDDALASVQARPRRAADPAGRGTLPTAVQR